MVFGVLTALQTLTIRSLSAYQRRNNFVRRWHALGKMGKRLGNAFAAREKNSSLAETSTPQPGQNKHVCRLHKKSARALGVARALLAGMD